MKILKTGLVVVGAATVFFAVTKAVQNPDIKEEHKEVYQETFDKNVAKVYTIKALSIPVNIDFAGMLKVYTIKALSIPVNIDFAGMLKALIV